MFDLLNGRPSKCQHCAVTALVFLLLMHCCGGQPQMFGPSTPIVAFLGGDIIMPSHLEPATDLVHKTLEWSRLDLKPRFVHVRRDGVDLLISQNPSYVGRTSVSTNNLKHGDVSLTLSKVRLTDAGTYRCHIPEVGTSVVELIVGALSSPVVIIARIDKESSTAVLQCEAKGWYPEPELFWLDGEGNLLSAGPTETVRGPDDLYTVSRRLTVRKSDNFTCRVQQKNINQTRETQIQILEDVFTASSCSAVRISVVLSVVGCCLLCSAAFIVCCKLRDRRHNKMHHDKGPEGGTAETDRPVEDLEDQNEEKLKEKEEEQNDIRHVISVLEEKKKELDKSEDKLISEIKEEEEDLKKKEKKLKALKVQFPWEKDERRKELLEAKQELDNKKTECKKSLQITVETRKETDGLIKRLTERKNKVEEQVEEMKKLLKETKRRDSTSVSEVRETESSPLTDGH